MKRYLITHEDAGHVDVVAWKGTDADHACERFLSYLADFGGAEGVRILSVKPHVTEAERITRRYRRNRVNPNP